MARPLYVEACIRVDLDASWEATHDPARRCVRRRPASVAAPASARRLRCLNRLDRPELEAAA